MQTPLDTHSFFMVYYLYHRSPVIFHERSIFMRKAKAKKVESKKIDWVKLALIIVMVISGGGIASLPLPYIMMGVIYIILVLIISLGIKVIERRFAKSDRN